MIQLPIPHVGHLLVAPAATIDGLVAGKRACSRGWPPPRWHSALSRTAPPISPPTYTRETTTTEVNTGYPLPSAPNLGRWLTLWQPDLMWVLLVGIGAALYGIGVRRMIARGDGWPIGRTIAWLLGLVVLYVTSGAGAAYGRVSFSGHVVMLMLLTMVAPPLLALGAPATLALQSLTARTDGSRGPREWLDAAHRSAVVRALAYAPVTAAILAGSLVLFYWTDLFGLSLRTHVGHELMLVYFLFAGYLFAWAMIGPDSLPKRLAHPQRLVLSFTMMAFLSFFGVLLTLGSTVLQWAYFTVADRDWGRELLADQQFAGSLAWAIGEIAALSLVLVRAAHSPVR